MAKEDLFLVRLKKLEKIKEKGVIPYFGKGERSHLAKEIKENFEKIEGKIVSVCGRITSLRSHGKLTFGDILDESGKIQILFRYDVIGEDQYSFLEYLDIGDFIEARGEVFKTKTGEITLNVKDYKLLTKSLLPLPEKWHGLSDVEERFRKRYLDLIVNQEVKKRFKIRSQIIAALREFFQNEGFMEVETPILHPLPGGANARPFLTHHNALDVDFYLRIAPELYLKKVLVGGFEKIFEIGKSFRNEGIDKTHNPEFTMLEAYFAYGNWEDGMMLEERLFEFLSQKVLGSKEIEYQGHRISIKPPFPKYTYFEIFEKYTGIDLNKAKNEKILLKEVKKIKIKNLDIEDSMTWSQIVDEVFKEAVIPHLIQPTFIYKYPASMVPLARPLDDDPFFVEKFQLYIGGLEITNNYSELADPLLQKERFKQQMRERKRGNEEAQLLDEEFIEALLHGMPPACGLGIGVDRLVMLFTNSPSLKEVILFPTLRPIKK